MTANARCGYKDFRKHESRVIKTVLDGINKWLEKIVVWKVLVSEGNLLGYNVQQALTPPVSLKAVLNWPLKQPITNQIELVRQAMEDYIKRLK